MLCTPILPLDLSTLVDRLTGPHVDKCEIPIILCTPIFTSLPVNPGRQIDRLTGEQVRNTNNALI